VQRVAGRCGGARECGLGGLGFAVDRVVVDVDAGGVRVSALVDGAVVAESGEAVAWSSPLDAGALGEVRWYLEDYLRAPFAVYEERGSRVAAALRGYGEALFSSVFGLGAARDAYVDARRGGGPGEIVVRSADAGVLGLPWELMADPGLPAPLALDGVAVTRMLPAVVPGRRFEVSGDRLRVLMVIARPAGDRDVAYQMVARRLLPLLPGLRGVVELTVLRPPTLREFERVVIGAAQKGTPFAVVHFDGHGAFAPNGAVAAGGQFPSEMYALAASGMLAFEAEAGGGADLVVAEKVAQVLSAGRVPLVVLNACQSGQVGGAVEAGVATRLLVGGASSVVAMAYSVYAVAAAEFMAVFYQQLFAGNSVGTAVAEARRHLAVADKRPSPKGRLALADWMVPVHYARTELSFPALRSQASPTDADSLQAIMVQVRGAATDTHQDRDAAQKDLAAMDGVFVGRDALLQTLDVAARLQRVVVLHGPGGTGKTELAKAFARWWRDTGGVDNPDWVLWHSFEPGVASFGLDGAVTAAGLRLFGPQFALLEPEQRRDALLKALAQHRVLLIWDNFESAAAMPDPTGATPPLDQAQREELAEFLNRVRTGTGSIVLTSRTPELWLGPEIRRVEVGGLSVAEAAEYTDRILQPYPRAQARRSDPAFAQLIEWLDGHPLSLRLTLPQLEHTAPAALLDGLRGLTPRSDSAAGGRTGSLAASVAYSFIHLPPTDRDALTILSLLHGIAHSDVLALFSGLEHAPARFRGIDLTGWERILTQAASLGLLSAVGGGMYRIHPALPAHLTEHWRTGQPTGFDTEREQATRALLDAHASFGRWLYQQLHSDGAATSVAFIDWQRRTLGALLGYALDHRLWMHAGAIAQPLNDYWDLRGLAVEARNWVERARTALEAPDGTPPRLDTTAGGLWMFLVGSEANRQTDARRFEQAEATHRSILDALEQQEHSPWQQKNVAASCHQLGSVAQARGDLQTAEAWYQRALTIVEELDDGSGAATVCHQLGRSAQERGDLQTAEAWYQRSLTIFEELGDRSGAARSYHQLGMVAQERGDLQTAEAWYQRSLTIFKELGDRSSAAASYSQLGVVAQERGDLQTAEAWYQRSLTIDEELGGRPGAAKSYHQLGTVAQERGDLQTAEAWYQRALTIFKELGDQPSAAASYHHSALSRNGAGTYRRPKPGTNAP